MRTASYILTAILVVGAGVFIWKKSASNDAPEGLNVQGIQVQTQSAEGMGQDVVTLTDGTTFTQAGYDLEHVGTLNLAGAKPAFLFKSFSCRGCEPVVNLVVYTAQNAEIHTFPFPGIHTLIGSDDEAKELDDQIVEGVFGACGGPAPKILLARKNREVESDGNSPRANPNWSFNLMTISFSSTGTLTTQNSPEDAFERLQALVSDECLAFAAEDSHDYQ